MRDLELLGSFERDLEHFGEIPTVRTYPAQGHFGVREWHGIDGGCADEVGESDLASGDLHFHPSQPLLDLFSP
jgi:hypothetical protein